MSGVLSALTTETVLALILVLVLCVALIVSARRRRRQGYKMNARVMRDDAPVPDPHDRSARELPNGGARVVGRQEPTFGTFHESTTGMANPSFDDEAVFVPSRVFDDPVEAGDTTSLDDVDEKPGTVDWLDEIEAVPVGGQSARLPRHEEAQVYSLNVVARAEQGFSGDDVLRTLLGCGLRFGDMDFFHLSEIDAGAPTIQFSVANMMQPGVFDLDDMEALSTKGLMFFVTLPGPADMTRAFDLMLQTAQTVAENLGGDVLDETRSVLTKQYVERARQAIREFEAKCKIEPR
jgi:cell division protein ZipA